MRRSWFTSSYSTNAGSCLEVKVQVPTAVVVRDSKNFASGTLRFSASAWRGFVGSVSVPQILRES
ncbi:DUF397 domain-containing protein [Amycolatopsis sp. NPDC059021]|uniref:DUF397 domain-containing protein n=1 Tax=Amycolatopsis sp. NPDC059021 TaxID=3346704 RepID=UPI00366FFEBF